MLPAITFDPVSHTYSDPGGLWLPGATRILGDLGYNKGANFFTEASRARGKAVHLVTQLIDEHALGAQTVDDARDVIDFDERIDPYLSGYLLFKRETGFIPTHNEIVVWSRKMRTAGQVDKVGIYRDGRRVLLDTKTWASQGVRPKRAAELQSGGYEVMAEESLDLKVDLRVILKLPGDGRYRAHECTNQRDKVLFMYAAAVWWDRKNYGLIEGDVSKPEPELES